MKKLASIGAGPCRVLNAGGWLQDNRKYHRQPIGAILKHTFALIWCTFWLIAGCGQSTMIQAITTAPPALGNFNDAAIVNYAELAKQQWGNKALSNEVMAYGGALSLAGLSAAAVASPSPAAKGMVIGLNGLLAVLGIVRPTDRDAAYNTGANLLLQAEGEYVIAVRQEGYCSVPTTLMSEAGAQLYQKTNAAIIVVNNLITGIIQEGFLNAMQILYQTSPQPAKLALKDAAPCK